MSSCKNKKNLFFRIIYNVLSKNNKENRINKKIPYYKSKPKRVLVRRKIKSQLIKKDIVNDIQYEEGVFPQIKCLYTFLKEERDANGNIICMIKKNGEKELFPTVEGLTINFFKGNNTIIFHEGTKFKNTKMDIGYDCFVFIGETSRNIVNMYVASSAASGTLYIEKGLSFGGGAIMFAENKKIYIGEDCMFSNNIGIRVSDGHSIFNGKNQLINEGKDVYIGNHVWIGHGVRIEKGSYISDNSVVGEYAVVTKKFLEKNVIIAGLPGKIIKRGIKWDRRDPRAFIPQNFTS